MCMWVHAMDQYADIFEEVKPRMDTVQVFTHGYGVYFLWEKESRLYTSFSGYERCC